MGLEPVIDETKTESAMKSARTLTDREKAELLEGLKPVEKRKKNPPLSPEELQAQKDTVIGYVRRSRTS